MNNKSHRHGLLLVCGVIIVAGFFFLNRSLTKAESQQEIAIPVVEKTSPLLTSAVTVVAAEAATSSIATDSSRDSCYDRLTAQVKKDSLYVERFHKELWENLNGIAPRWFIIDKESFKAPTNESSVSEKFLSALAYAHLLYGFDDKKVPLDYQKALQLFNEVYLADRRNSAPLAMAAIIHSELKNKNLVLQNLQQIKTSTEYFDTYESKIHRKLFKTVKTPSDYILLTKIAFTRPVLNVKPLIQLMKEYQASYLAEQLVATALNENSVMPDFDWNALHYAAGVAVLKKLNPERKLPSSIELTKQKVRSNILDELYPTNLEKNCNLKELEPAISAVQKAISKYEN